MTYQEMLDSYSRDWGTTPDNLENIMNKVAYHESKGQNIYQEGGGPGAGIFQYETGPERGGMTARNRLAGEFGEDVPDWLFQENMKEKGFDASKLSEKQQKMLFLSDKKHHPAKESGLYPESTGNLGNWWGKYHWAGAKEGSDEYTKKVASFDRDLEDYERYKQPVDDVMAGYNNVNSAFSSK